MGLDMYLTGRKDGVETDLGYWRKANAVHNFFVEVVQNGEDECQEIAVSVSDLHTLMNACRDVLDNPGEAESILPTVGGFFFGSTEYDSGYFDDIRHTIKVVEDALAFANEGGEVFYQSSW